MMGSLAHLVTMTPGQMCTLCRSSPTVQELLSSEKESSAATLPGARGVSLGRLRHLRLPQILPLWLFCWSDCPGRSLDLFQTLFTRRALPQQVALQITQ